jgi:ribonuclease HII
MTIEEIRQILSSDSVSEDVLNEISEDPRKGVQKLFLSYARRQEKEAAERFRVESLYKTESQFYKKGLKYIVGMDEVGRGPLAGPVTVAAVILPPHFFIEGLNDSKKVTPKKREEISRIIHESAVDISIWSMSPEEIDSLNIYQATMCAMYEAVKHLKVDPEAVIVDAMPLHFKVPTVSLIHGDAKSASVAAASIVAKVYRDHLMDEYDETYPGYGFKKNKGYGTKEHIEAIQELGITPIHRKSFEPIKSYLANGIRTD